MNKVKVNNQVVSMRKFVKQAKVHVINKLVKEIKQYQVKKGKEEQMAKNVRKAERLKSKIEIIKKLSVDDVSKMALLNQKNWSNIITDKTTTVEERSFAKLINYKIIQQEVKKFHEKNPDLVQQLPEFLNQWEQKKLQSEKEPVKNITASELRRKKKEKKLRMKNKKHLKKISLQDNRAFLLNTSGACENHQNVDEDMVSENRFEENDLVSNVSNEDNSHEKETNINDSDTNDHSATNVVQQLASANRENVKGIMEKLNRKKRTQLKVKAGDDNAYPHKVNSQEKIKKPHEIKSFNIDKMNENNLSSFNANSCDEPMSSRLESDDSTLNEKVIDPFFLGDSVVYEKNTESDAFFDLSDKRMKKQNNSDRNLFSTNKPFKEKNKQFVRKSLINYRKPFGNFGHNELYSNNSGRKKSYLRTEKAGGERCGMYSKGKLILRKNSSKPNFHIQDRRMKQSESVYSQKSYAPRRDRKETFQAKNSPSKHKPKESATTGLHPSWEAKRKLKEKTWSNIPYQGKKIKFED